MQILPTIFDARANFIEPSPEVLAGLDAPTLERLNGVRVAAANLQAAQDAEKAEIQAIADCIEAVQEAKDQREALFPPSTAHDEWIMNFGSAEQRRELAQRRGA
jgi:hypothetical protein